MRQRHFPDQPRAVGDARHFVAEVLANQPAALIEKACLLVSELATNAVCHAHSEFHVTVELRYRQVRVEVHDIGSGLPRMQSPSLSEPHGRGLQIVALLADAWGLVEGSPHGKTIWFTVGTKADDRASMGEPRSKLATRQDNGAGSAYRRA